MGTQLTAEHAKQSLSAHVESKGIELFSKYGPDIGWDQLNAIVCDRSCVRYPCAIEFDASRLQAGEFAFPEPKAERPEDGFTIFIHPRYRDRLDQVPLLVLYQIVIVNYGEFASPEDAEIFASTALGLERDIYYNRLCTLADELEGTGAAETLGPSEQVGRCSCGGHC